MIDSIVGVSHPPIDLTLTLPTARKDGTALKPSHIHSVTVMRDAGAGPVLVQELHGPFEGKTIRVRDTSPVTGNDVYSFFVTDAQGTPGEVSAPVMVSVAESASEPAAEHLAPIGAGTLTAVQHDDAHATPLPKPASKLDADSKAPPKADSKQHAAEHRAR